MKFTFEQDVKMKFVFRLAQMSLADYAGSFFVEGASINYSSCAWHLREKFIFGTDMKRCNIFCLN